MPAKIDDEFSSLPVSRQRIWQLRNNKAGKCGLCVEPLAPNNKSYCVKHAADNREHYHKAHPEARYNRPRIVDEFTARLDLTTQQRRYLRARRDKICVRCCQKPAVPDRVECSECTALSNARRATSKPRLRLF